MAVSSQTSDLDTLPPAMALQTVVLLLTAVVVGAVAGAVALPQWAPALSDSLLGTAPKAYWYLSRASAIVAFVLLWMSIVLGLTLTNRTARIWPGGPVVFDLHQHTSLLALIVAFFHGLILMGDRYIAFTLTTVLTPFASADYRPFWVGLGQIGFYLLGIVGLSFYARRWMGARLWRVVHYLSFGVFILALIHGIVSGTDTSSVGVAAMYWIAAGSVVFLTLHRVLVTGGQPARARS